MQQTIDRKQRRLDVAFIVIHTYALLFGGALILLAIASPSIALATGDWIGVPFCMALGIMGYLLVKISSKVIGRAIGSSLARLTARRAERRLRRDLAVERLATLTTRPAADALVRVLEPTWTPYGVIQPGELGAVVDLDVDDEELVVVRWKRGEAIHDYRHLVLGA